MKWHPWYYNEVWMGWGNAIMRSTTNGLTYDTVWASPDKGAVIEHIEICRSNPNVMYSFNDGGIFRTNDCTAGTVSWTSLNNGYLTSMFYTVAIDHATSGNDIVVGGAQDNGSWFTNNTNAFT